MRERIKNKISTAFVSLSGYTVIIGVYYCKGVWQGRGYGTDTCDNLLICIGNAK